MFIEIFDTPLEAALAVVCAIGALVFGAMAGARAAHEERQIRAARRTATPMRTANSSLIDRQVRELQRRSRP